MSVSPSSAIDSNSCLIRSSVLARARRRHWATRARIFAMSSFWFISANRLVSDPAERALEDRWLYAMFSVEDSRFANSRTPAQLRGMQLIARLSHLRKAERNYITIRIPGGASPLPLKRRARPAPAAHPPGLQKRASPPPATAARDLMRSGGLSLPLAAAPFSSFPKKFPA